MDKPQKQTWFFDSDGYTRFPLYHGTSSYFLPSIEEHGLGGRNIVAEWRILEMRRELYVVRKWPYEPVAHAEGGMWGYGEVYVTPYEERATRYQSELLDMIKKELYRMKRALRDELLSRYPELTVCLAARHNPIILRLPRLHMSELLGWGSDDPCDHSSMCTFEDFKLSLTTDSVMPTPTFRLRNPLRTFEVIELPIVPHVPVPRRVKTDDDLWPLSPHDEWLLDFFLWAVVPSKYKADRFSKGYIEHAIAYVSNIEVNRALRQLGYVFPDGYKDDEPYQRVRWKWRSLDHKNFLGDVFNNVANSKRNDLSRYGSLASEFKQIQAKASDHDKKKISIRLLDDLNDIDASDPSYRGLRVKLGVCVSLERGADEEALNAAFGTDLVRLAKERLEEAAISG